MSKGLKINLDDVNALTSFDNSRCHDSIEYLPLQLEKAWAASANLNIEIDTSNLSAIYFCGMGGSAYPGRIIKYLYKDSLSHPLEIVDNYNLPQSVNSKSLIFCASYSGNTEETLSCANQALKKNLKMIGISSGGMLGQLFGKNNKSIYIFNPENNPSNQPRLGQGYLIGGILSLFSKLNLISLNREIFAESLTFLNERNILLNKKTPLTKNPAKSVAMQLEDRLVFFIAADFLEGTVHAIRNPINETGKQFASYFILPELNHHLLEGLGFPENLKQNVIFCLINSNQYSEKNQKRMELTKEVLVKNSIDTTTVNLTGETRLIQTFELIQFSSYLSFYLSAVNGVNPAPVPWVDYFKKKLGD